MNVVVGQKGHGTLSITEDHAKAYAELMGDYTRHFHATLMLQAGANPKIVQERLGHSSFAITMDTYSHVVPGLQEQAAKDFAAAMGRAKHAQK